MATNDATSDTTNSSNSSDTLMKLSDMGATIKLGDEDVRRYCVKDRDGHDIGKVHDLLVDPRGNKVRFLVVESGGFLGMGERKSFIPVDAITRITTGEVHIDQTRERVAGAPPYDPSWSRPGTTTKTRTTTTDLRRTGWVAIPTQSSPSTFWGLTASRSRLQIRIRHYERNPSWHCQEPNS
ncbi:PRC-barrel domain-containing protein [Arthrobacter sp. E3]|uniref:PRC-barrel domain-containing protein n=1 Tax=Arthrobacter sp. E3 TaxID=517402 RepID=UPI001FFC6376|nr:PRC-barrel domain-containing protein [Arthrobacter sp. E3]